MMKKMFKVAFIALSLMGGQIAAGSAASANEAGLMKYAQEPTVKKADVLSFKPFKVASRYTRRRNRAIASGIAVGIAALIISEAVRAERRRHRHRHHHHHDYDDDRYATPRQCRRWADRCDYDGARWACRKWNHRCRY